jgi:hypothetical protein
MSIEEELNQPSETVERAPPPTQEYTVMSDAFVAPAEKPKEFTNDSDGLKEAAEEVTERRQKELPIIPREYVTYTPDSPEHGKPRPLNETVSLERAATDIERQRGFEAEAIENAAKDATALEVDLTRLGADLAQQQAEPQQAPDIAPQPIDPGMPPEVAELAAELERSPKLKAALEQEAQRIQAAQQEAAQARDAYSIATNQAYAFAIQSMVAAVPELQGIGVENMAAALQVLQQSNPERHAVAVQHLHHVDALGRQAAENQRQQSQIQQQQLARYFQEQDAAMDAHLARTERPEVIKSVKESLPRIVKETYGIEPAALLQAMQTTPALRSFEFQKVLFDAARYQLAQQGISEKQYAAVPPVQKPGVSRPMASRDQADVAAAREKFLKNPNDLKIAAAYVQSRRNARGS